MNIRLKVIGLKDDPANQLKIGDIVEINMESYESIYNIGGAHYSVDEMYMFFEVIE